MRKLLLTLLVFSFTASICFGATARSKNFIVEAPSQQFAEQAAEVAEACRDFLAETWLGDRLPGNWSEPCPIKCRVGTIGAGGATTFQILTNGEVVNWSMTVQGTPEALLRSVIPHEVSHTVFASHFRKPLPRCLDEGAAMQVEVSQELAVYREILAKGAANNRLIPFEELFSLMDYPREMEKTLMLYAQGHSLVEWLVSLHGDEGYHVFTRFMERGIQNGWNEALKHYYGYTVREAQKPWWEWYQNSTHRAQGGETAEEEPETQGHYRLLCFSATWCMPCKAWKKDLQDDPKLFNHLKERWRYETFYIDQNPSIAPEYKIESVPTFIVLDPQGNEVKRWTNYEGKQSFIDHLAQFCPNGFWGNPGWRVPPQARGGWQGVPNGQQYDTEPPDRREDPYGMVAGEGDWSKVKVVALIRKEIDNPILGLGAEMAEDRLAAFLEQKFYERTNGQGELIVVFERTQPNRFAAITSIIGPPAGIAKALVMVDAEAEGLKGLAVGAAEYMLQAKFGSLLNKSPVLPLFQRLDARGYNDVMYALTAREGLSLFGVYLADYIPDQGILGFFFVAFLFAHRVFRIVRISKAAHATTTRVKEWFGWGLDHYEGLAHEEEEDDSSPPPKKAVPVPAPAPKKKVAANPVKKTATKTVPLTE